MTRTEFALEDADMRTWMLVTTLVVAAWAAPAAQAQRFALPGRQRAFEQGQAIGAARQAAFDRGAVPVGRFYAGAAFAPYAPRGAAFFPTYLPPAQVQFVPAPTYVSGFVPGFAPGYAPVPTYAPGPVPGGCGAALFPRY